MRRFPPVPDDEMPRPEDAGLAKDAASSAVAASYRDPAHVRVAVPDVDHAAAIQAGRLSSDHQARARAAI